MKILKNQHGVAMLQALMISIVVGISAGFILNQMRLTETTLIIPRIRSEMLVAESAFRNMAYMSSIYWCDSAIGASSCKPSGPLSPPVGDPDLADTYLQQFESDLPNCTPSPCGIRYSIGGQRYAYNEYTTDAADVTAGRYAAAGLKIYRLSTTIRYGVLGSQQVSGKGISVAPIDITIDIPEHILTGAPFRCAAQDPTRPFFRGFNSDGTPNCTGFLGANQTNGRCNRGYYLKSFNANTMTLSCEQLRTTSALFATNSCDPATQFIGTINWNTGDGDVGMTCSARTNAFTYFSVNPYATVIESP